MCAEFLLTPGCTPPAASRQPPIAYTLTYLGLVVKMDTMQDLGLSTFLNEWYASSFSRSMATLLGIFFSMLMMPCRERGRN